AGVRQAIVLGAGLDTFGLRRPETLSDLGVLEVAPPATQRWKRGRLAELGLPLPDLLSFVECAFETTSVTAALRGTAFRPDRPAVVSWMGVVYYLAKGTVSRAVGGAGGVRGPG